MKIENIDKNFIVNTELSRSDVTVYDVCDAPFTVHGLIKPKDENDRFRRMPEDIAGTVSEGVLCLHANTTGGRVRFRTDAEYIAISAKMPSRRIGRMSHFTLVGSSGFDLYTEIDGKQHFIKSFVPPYDVTDGYSYEFIIPDSEMREYTLNFPLYSDVSRLYIILNSDAKIELSREYRVKTPVVYYGSSITQGGCASRPGNSYQNIISRMLDCDYINLGFSGKARGEVEMAEYISKLDMSAFVYDYDHNAPTTEHLAETHKRMFDIIRKAKPDIPIICVSRPVGNRYEQPDEWREIILETVNEAKNAGDNNVYFVDGGDFGKLTYASDSITVDGCHPNDLGFACMAELIGKTLMEVL